MKKILEKIKKWFGNVNLKKHHLELITAALSIPMMITVILVNFNNINSQKEKDKTADTVTPIQVVIDSPATQSTTTNSTATDLKVTPSPTIAPTKFECKKDIGPIEILSPQEDEIISTNNVCINISTDNKYCSVVWSYRLGTDSWSEFNNKDICLYNLSPGKKKLQIKIKSTAVDKTVTIERNFIYQSATATPVASPSATPSL